MGLAATVGVRRLRTTVETITVRFRRREIGIELYWYYYSFFGTDRLWQIVDLGSKFAALPRPLTLTRTHPAVGHARHVAAVLVNGDLWRFLDVHPRVVSACRWNEKRESWDFLACIFRRCCYPEHEHAVWRVTSFPPRGSFSRSIVLPILLDFSPASVSLWFISGMSVFFLMATAACMYSWRIS